MSGVILSMAGETGAAAVAGPNGTARQSSVYPLPMPQTAPPNPILPGSRYAAELAKDARDMRFPPDLEYEYRNFYLAERRSHVRYFNSVMCAIAIVALLASVLLSHGNAGVAQYLRLGFIAGAYFALAGLARSRYYAKAYLAAAHWASLLIATVLAIEVASWIHAGVGELYALLTLHSLGLYFLAGILFRAALQANVAMTLSLAVTLMYLDTPWSKVAYLTGILAGAGAIGGLAFRHQGSRFRHTFLEHGLVAEMAARDGLTGLKNRRAFDEHLVRTWKQALRDRRMLAVMMIDVDFFKKYNDRYGHQAGDETLQKVAGVVDDFAKRPLDVAARYGGEEMALILFDVPRQDADKMAEHLRASVQSLGIEHATNSAASVITVSIGVAIISPRLERSPQGVVQLADEALYAAKDKGRNCICVYETEYEAMSTGRFVAP